MILSEHFFDFLYSRTKDINLFHCIEQSKGSPDVSLDSEPAHQRLGTVCAGSYGNTHFIHYHSRIKLVYITY